MIKACKKCRRAGEKLMLKGERCMSAKCAVVKRPYAPGQTGQGYRSKLSEFGKQLREKQNAKRIYGIAENQFASYADKAGKMVGNSAENLMRLLETRLDNVVYRLGYASSRSEARQYVSHGLFKVNGRKTTIPSFILSIDDEIEPMKKEQFKELNKINLPSWIDFNTKSMKAKIKHIPSREEIDTIINENLIIEFYSR